MTAEEVGKLTTTIITDLNAVATFAGVLDPALLPFISIGKAVDKLVPGLAVAVASWIAGNPPTDAELADLKAKLAVLGDPGLA